MLRLSSLTLAQNGALENTAKLANTAKLEKQYNPHLRAAQCDETKERLQPNWPSSLWPPFRATAQEESEANGRLDKA